MASALDRDKQCAVGLLDDDDDLCSDFDTEHITLAGTMLIMQ